MDIDLLYVPHINDSLATRLYRLTNSFLVGSAFRLWLNNYRAEMVAVLIYLDREIIGWSACRETSRIAEVGVYIEEKHRRQGLGTLAFDTLLLYLKKHGKASGVPISYDRDSHLTHMMEQHIPLFGFSLIPMAA